MLRKRFVSLLRVVMALLLMMACVSGALAAGGDAAQIGSQSYATLQAAINAAKDGDTIVMLRDVTEDIIFPGYQADGTTLRTDAIKVTLEMDNYTLTSANDKNTASFVHIIGGWNVTMKNGTLTGVTADKKFTVYLGDATLTGENLTFSGNKPAAGTARDSYTAGAIYTYLDTTAPAKDPVTGGTHSSASIIMKDCAFTGNEVTSCYDAAATSASAGAITAYAASGKTLNVSLTDCEISGNKAPRWGAVYFSGAANTGAKLTVNGTTISGNTVTKAAASGAAVYTSGIYGMAAILNPSTVSFTNSSVKDNAACGLYAVGTMTMNGCSVSGNASPSTARTAGGLFVSNSSNKAATVTLTNTRVYNNSAENGTKGCGGAWVGAYSTLHMKNSAITGNRGSQIGGVGFDYYDNLKMPSGSGSAIYGNKTTGSNSSGEHDIFFVQNMFSSSYPNDIMAAANMKDGSRTFEGYTWMTGTATVGAINNTLARVYRGFTAKIGTLRNVALNVNTNTAYPSVQEAMDAASSGDTIRLIAGEDGKTPKTIIESVEVKGKVTLDLNGRTLDGSNTYALQVEEGGSLTLTGSGTTMSTANAIINYGKLTVDPTGSMTTGHIVTNTSDFDLKGDAQIDSITLGINCTMTADDDVTGPLQLALYKDTIAVLNAGTNTAPVPLILPYTGETLSALAAKVSVEEAGMVVEIKADDKGRVVADSRVLDGVYIDGVNGSDDNDGLSVGKPVRTFAKAAEVLAANSKFDGIYVLGTVPVRNTQTWTLPEGKTMMRYPGFKGDMVSVSGTLTLENIVLDGSKSSVTAKGSIVDVNGGTLNINTGAVLQNNRYGAANEETYGGAVSAQNAKITLDGGTITGNQAFNGGGIYAQKSQIEIKSGSISGNIAASPDDNTKGAGGGVMVNYASTITMTGGEISGNTSYNWGGGIALGVAADPAQPCGMTMTGGTIANNTSSDSGGGLFIQCESTATISGGSFTGNMSTHHKFAGGGIYVNGGRIYTGGTAAKDGLLILKNAIVTDNSAKSGGAYAGCETSSIEMFNQSAAALYGNSASDGGREIYTGAGFSEYRGASEIILSETMLGGGAYNWKDENGERVVSNRLTGAEAFIKLDSAPDAAAISAAQAAYTAADGVMISGNSAANGYGGGIASNGDVQIGEEGNEISIPVKKIWVDAEGAEMLTADEANNRYLLRKSEAATIHPASFRVWLTRDGEDYALVDFERTEVTVDGVDYYAWPMTMTFAKVPQKDHSGRAYVYGVREVMPENTVYTVEIEGDVTGFVITNTFAPTGSIILTAAKTVDGREPAEGEVFTFTLTGDGVSQTKQNVGGTVTFDPIAYTLADIGEHTYTITENAADGYETDPSVYTVTVTVELAGGELSAQVTSIKRDGEAADAVVFGNEHVIYGTQIVLTAQKRVDGREPAAGEVFTFALTGDGVSQTKQNAGGMVTFDPITYSEGDEGEHVYTITEQAQDGYETDPSVYTVTVTVTVGEDYRLNAQITSIKRDGAEADAVVFDNEHIIDGTQIVLSASKTVDGREPAEGEVFTFTLE
ncbi:MAG: Cna B-type domain-containing protein, partial [Clostridia bacterium]|nr:Cna B-type domain-containing protein [Clostridia bacterium]